MRNDHSEQHFEKAMQVCASEPVHIPGCIQPFACLLGIAADSGRISYASENCDSIIGMQSADLLGKELQAVFGDDITHALNNVLARSGFSESSTKVGLFQLGDGDVDLHAFASGDTHVLQFEKSQDQGLGGSDALNTLSFLMTEIQTCTDDAALFDLTTDLLRHVSGYDRVMIYKFDRDFNGEVIAETKQRAMDTFLGLRFPHWDIPSQARAIMLKLPLRFIEDVDQEPILLRAADASLPPLDITLAECRGVSPVHMEYLRNMKIKATMTLSIKVEGALWGMISFHHRSTRVPAPQLRELLTAFLQLFSTKLSTLTKQRQLDLVRKTDAIKDFAMSEIEGDGTIDESLALIRSVINDVLEADGFAFQIGSRTLRFGKVPEQDALEHIQRAAQDQPDTSIVSENLSALYPQFKDMLNGCAGVLASASAPNRTLCIFRGIATQSVSWAGNPEKKIESHSGTARLAPRGSFSKYLEEIEGSSFPWTDGDVYFAERIWVLINSAEHRGLKNMLNRQQALMIDELNHRVRNILALVRSVSRQARRHYGSLESYSASLENRITALAAAHDIASGSLALSVGLRELIRVETAPYQKDNRISISGDDLALRADIAPIFSLVIHELTTNAAKYGSLSTNDGKVAVTTTRAKNGISVGWREAGGPIVTPPNDRGFGSVLIEQAVPHELGGQAELRFPQTGVEADIFLPDDVLDFGNQPAPRQELSERTHMAEVHTEPFDPSAFEGFVLLLEDNFVIAKDMQNQLEEAGIDDVAITSTAADALDILSGERPAFAILDVNLGAGMTSEPVALELQRQKVPFVFATGYGDKAKLAEQLNNVPRLTKPVTRRDLLAAMMAKIMRVPECPHD